ncbi:hypothetical protein BD289DRAFT_431248 [Coniella lustricola]|uniref:Uncharacterized protein n=1 Tax=Coniella lustricola TaxID=2025994 RepID=A0A2T3AB66_9PEZI|nr:hypothetical protein BD289DRAFT_431248 [Coniella lustricola]
MNAGPCSAAAVSLIQLLLSSSWTPAEHGTKAVAADQWTPVQLPPFQKEVEAMQPRRRAAD